ncbi:MAG: helix-turn-helix transcriptional regulator [Xanthobacteraceae bacterium]
MTALQMAEIAALVGDPARAIILSTLFDGRALSATELSFAAGVTPQTTSGHLAWMTQAGLLTVLKQGCHRYYRLATPQVAQMLESIMTVAARAPPRHRPRSAREERLRQARTCYDHLAGVLGVSIADALCERRHVILSDDGGEVTEAGMAFLHDFGAGFPRHSRRPFCRHCLDWTERRFHLSGTVGAAIATRCFDLGWVRRERDPRALQVTPKGREGFRRSFGFSI